jgi:hypothetical protein
MTSYATLSCVPDALQHAVLLRRAGTARISAFCAVPVLQRIIPLRCMLRCARDTCVRLDN